MSYRLALEDRARADLGRLPRALRAVVGEALMTLAGDPVTLSRPAVFPYPSGAQIYHFQHDPGGETWHAFTAHFRYGQDEETLHILGIGHVEYDKDIPETFDPDLGA